MARRIPPLPITLLLPLLFAGIVVLSVLPVLIAGYVGVSDNTARLLRDRSELALATVIEHLVAYLGPVETQVETIAAAVSGGSLDPENAPAFEMFTAGALASAPQVKAIAWVRADGTVRQVFRGMRPKPDDDFTDIAATPGADATPRWHAPAWSRGSGQPVVRLSVPLTTPDGRTGVLAVAIGTAQLSAFLQRLRSSMGASTPYVLFGRDLVLAHPQLDPRRAEAVRERPVPLPRTDEIGDPVLAGLWREPRNPLTQIAPLQTARGHWTWIDDRSHAYVFREITEFGDTPWTVGVTFPGADTRRERWIVRGVAIAGAVMLLLSVLAAVVLGRRLGRHIEVLTTVAGRVEALEFDSVRSLPRGRIREIDEALAAFERMAAGLRWFETYLPRTLVRRLIASGGQMPESELREVTILFADLQGYSALSQRMRPLAMADYLNSLLARIGPLIEAGGGTIDKYTGDGVMAFWGAPDDRPDHAAAACRAAVDIAGAVTAFNRDRRAAGLPACAMRIGLHTGPVVVGNVGFRGKVDYTLIGSAVNAAQRVEQFGRGLIGDAEVVVLVSAATERAAGAGSCDFDTVAEECVVAAGERLRVWRLVA